MGTKQWCFFVQCHVSVPSVWGLFYHNCPDLPQPFFELPLTDSLKKRTSLRHQFFLEQNCPILMVCTMLSIVGCGVVRIRWSRIILLMKIAKNGTYGYAAIPQIHRLIIIFWHIPHCNAINIAIAITWGRPLTFPWFSRDFISWWIFHNLHWSIDPLHEVQSLWGKNGWILRRLIGTRRFFTGFWWSNVTCSPFSRKIFTGNHRFSHIETGNHRCSPCFYRVFRFRFSHQSIDLSADSLRRRWRPPSKVSLRQQLGATATAVPTLLRGGHWPSAAWLRDWGGLTWWLKR